MTIKNVKSVLLALVMIASMFSFMVVSSTEVSAATDVSSWTELATAISGSETTINIVGDVSIPFSNSFNLDANRTINIQNGASLTTSASSTFYIDGIINNLGTFTNGATLNVQNGGLIRHQGTTFTNNGTMNFTNNSILNTYHNNGDVTNTTGTITFDSSDFITPSGAKDPGGTINYNNGSLEIVGGSTDVDTVEQLVRAVANANVISILITTDINISRTSSLITLPQNKTIHVGNGVDSISLIIENQFVNEGTINVNGNSYLTLSNNGLIANKGTVTSTGNIVGGSPSTGTVSNNMRFDVANSSLFLYNINNETYYTTSATNRVLTPYTGPLTLYGITNANIVGVETSGTYNIIMDNLFMHTLSPIPFSAAPDTTLNISLIGNNLLSGLDAGLSHYAGLAPNTMTITSTSGGRLSATGANPVSSTGIFAGDNNVIIGGNAVVTATGDGDGSGILSNNIVLQDTASLTGIHASSSPNAFSSRPTTLNPSSGYQAVVRAGASTPGTVVADHTSDYHLNAYANVSMEPIVIPTTPTTTATTATTTTTDTVPAGMISPQTGVYS